jgi:DNA-binding response OmpR family regulator
MKRILIIEDDEQLRPMIRRILEKAGYGVVEAPNGKEGIRLFRAQSADLIITDIFMPEKEGLETITELRRDFPDVRIIAMSGGGIKTGTFSTLPYAKALGAHGTLSKPFQHRELLDMVEAVLGK